MVWMLESLALLAVGCLGALTIIFFKLRGRLRKQFAYHQAAAIHKFPQRLGLKRLERFAWRKLSRGPQRVESFKALGFEELGGFSVDELPGARLFVLQHPTSGRLGLVNEHEQLGTWSDVLLFIAGETQPILASSILQHCHFFFLPGSPKIHKHRATEEELGNAVKGAAGAQAGSRLTADAFARRYEEAFAESVDHRLLEPLQDNELRRLLRDHRRPCCEEELSDVEFERIKNAYPYAVANELRLVCAAQFLRETSLPASQWQEARERILVIHDRTSLRELTQKRLIYGAYLTESMKEGLRRQDDRDGARKSFAEFNAALPAWERYKKLGEVSRPIPADIYRAPIPRKTA